MEEKKNDKEGTVNDAVFSMSKQYDFAAKKGADSDE